MNDSLDNAASDTSDLDKLKRQAKQRFIGATVLVLIAVIAFPFILDSQPRPLPASVVIDIPKMDAAPLVAPATATATTPISTPTPVTALPDAPVTPSLPSGQQTQPASPLAFSNDGARAQALLNGNAASTKAVPPQSKYIVQAGSYSDADKLKAAAAKLDKAGLAHYTQAAEGKDGTPRTRLRLVGPFASREEANAAAAKVVKLGVASIVLKP